MSTLPLFPSAPRVVLLTLCVLLAGSGRAPALTFSLEGVGGWPNQAHYDAAAAAAASSIDRYNAYGDFNNINSHVYIYYEPGIPTAQANFGGSVGYGGTYPGERVMMHEMAHFLGLPSGAWGAWMADGVYDGARGAAKVRQFDGDQAVINGDGAHFWPYGLNFDSEGSEINKQRQVAMVYAMRADLGIGPAAHPSTATSVTLTASDPFGESGFNYAARWSDGYFAHPGAAYSTGPYILRTPESGNSFTFAGDSLTLDNPAVDTGLYFKGLGAAATTTFPDLILDGGWIDHRATNGLADLFQLDGSLTVASGGNLRAKQGNIHVLADVHGAGTLNLLATDNPTENNRYVRFYSSENTFTGDLVNSARFELAAGANFLFDIGPSGDNNAISGASARNTLLNGVFAFDFADAGFNLGDSWTLVTAANTTYGASFDLEGFYRVGRGTWRNGSYKYVETTGLLTVAPGADLDGDGDIDATDYQTFLANHLTDLSSFTVAQRAARGDLDLDGDNDFDDFRLFQQQFATLGGPGALADLVGLPTPEPASAMMLLLGCSAFARRRIRSTGG